MQTFHFKVLFFIYCILSRRYRSSIQNTFFFSAKCLARDEKSEEEKPFSFIQYVRYFHKQSSKTDMIERLRECSACLYQLTISPTSSEIALYGYWPWNKFVNFNLNLHLLYNRHIGTARVCVREIAIEEVISNTHITNVWNVQQKRRLPAMMADSNIWYNVFF